MFLTFLSQLEVERLDDGEWRLERAFSAYIFDGAFGETITVPTGFVTDFSSVPRLPVAYLLAGGTAVKASVLHDWLYVTQGGRSFADEVFLAAMKEEGVPRWRRWLMYTAVRVFAGFLYSRKNDR